MKRTSTLLRTLGIVTFLAVASLTLPLAAHAGGVHVSIGFGLPFPVAVIAPPPPVVIAPQHVIVQPAPVVVYPAPVVVRQPPVVVAGPRVVYTYPYYGAHGGYRHWRHYHRY
jgi:hypothetical protein